MLTRLFQSILIPSCAGAALTGLLCLLTPVTRRRFSARWHYYIYLAILLVMLLPVRIPPLIQPEPVPAGPAVPLRVEWETPGAAHPLPGPQPEAQRPGLPMRLAAVCSLRSAAVLWLAGAVLALLAKVGSYLLFLRRVNRGAREVACPTLTAYTRHRVRVKLCPQLRSPMTVGPFRPTLLLPETRMTPGQFRNVLAHEATHLNRRDLLYKWFAALVKCVHWFNPAVYVIQRRINLECELSCDIAVVAGMDRGQELDYIDTILMLNQAGCPVRFTHPLATGMVSGKKLLQRRFLTIKYRKPITKPNAAVSAALAGVLLLTGLLGSGRAAYALAERTAEPVSPAQSLPVPAPATASAPAPSAEPAPLPEPEGAAPPAAWESPKAPETPTEPPMESPEPEPPVTETTPDAAPPEAAPEKTPAAPEPDTAPAEDSGEAPVLHSSDSQGYWASYQAYTQPMTLAAVAEAVGGRLTQSQEAETEGYAVDSRLLNLAQSCRAVDYDLDTGVTHCVTLRPSAEGEVSLFFDTAFDTAEVRLCLYPADETPRSSQYLPTRPNLTYHIDGLDPNREYRLEFGNYYPGHYGITGRALIY